MKLIKPRWIKNTRFAGTATKVQKEAEKIKIKLCLAKYGEARKQNVFNEKSGQLFQSGASWPEILQFNQKKAVEQEFSWSGLLISMSIAFFIIVISASSLNFINHYRLI